MEITIEFINSTTNSVVLVAEHHSLFAVVKLNQNRKLTPITFGNPFSFSEERADKNVKCDKLNVKC